MRSIVLLLVTLLVAFARSKSCHSDLNADFGPANPFDILDADRGLELVSTVANGKMYELTIPNEGGNATQVISVLHVYGTPYEMGYAHGELAGSKLQDMLDAEWQEVLVQVEQVVSFLPSYLQELVADIGLDAALDLTYEITKDWSNPDYYVEMQAICDASGADYDTLRRVHQLAGLTQGACSAYGMWGDAVAGGETLFQLRALDWDMESPVRDYPAIIVYHPSSESTYNSAANGHAFLSVGFLGFVGTLTGISSTQLGISEIGVTYPDSTWGEESRFGEPFIFVLRDILQYDYTIDDAINRMANTRRTCSLILGVGDGKEGYFRGFQYSYSDFNILDDYNNRPTNDTWHPLMKDTVYWGMDWECPSFDYSLATLIKQNYGNITAENAIQISALMESGSNHIAIMDLTNQLAYLSFAGYLEGGGPANAWSRQYIKVNTTTWFTEQL